jgi:hypothetical protein
MYISSLNRLLVAVIVFGLLLQGCRTDFQVASGDSERTKLRKTSDDEQVSLPAVLSSMVTAASVTAPSAVIAMDQMASLMHHLAVEDDAVSDREATSSMASEAEDKQPAAIPTAVAELSLVGRSESSRATPFSVPSPVFGAEEWARCFGEVGAESSLPANIAEILDGPCPFWPGKRVQDTHLLVLIPSTVDGEAFTLDLLEELVQNPHREGHHTQYFLYDDEVQRSSGAVYSSIAYWVLLTRDVLPGSRNKPYEVQRALVATRSSHVDDPPYSIPNVLEAATAILSHYVRSGDRLYEGFLDDKTETSSTSTRCTGLSEAASEHPSPFTVGRFCDRGLAFLSGFDDDGDVEFGISCLRRFGSRHYRPSALLHSFGAEEWRRYFGEVGVEPSFPSDIAGILNSTCPFWPDRQVKDTHLLVLIPATVHGKPFSLNLLGELVRRPQSGGYSTKYRVYASDVREPFGAQSPTSSYWVLMTRDVLEGSRMETYENQQALVAEHARRTQLPYELPGALEAATAVLSHYVRSRECLYSNSPYTYTRCRELEDGQYPVVVGGFSSGGLSVFSYDGVGDDSSGVAGFRKF